MHKTRIVASVLLLACMGCGERKSEMQVRMANAVNDIVRSESRGLSGSAQGEKFLEDLVALTNVEMRIAGLEEFAKSLLAVPLDSDGFLQWDRSLSAVPSLVRSVCVSLAWSGEQVEKVYAVRLDLLAWHRRQLERLQSRRPGGSGNPPDEAWRTWCRCRNRVSASLDMTVELLERRFDDDTKELPQDRRDALRRKVEASLGRPLRSAETVRKERRERVQGR